MIDIKNATYTYRSNAAAGDDGVPAVNNVTAQIPENQFIAIVGANGSGKSTLARLINGLLLPDTGLVVVDDNSTVNADRLQAIRQSVGLVFQNPDNQIIGGTVEEDVAFGPENLALSVEQVQERVLEALELVGMSDLARREPHMLSGGQKQRLALAGVLAMRPKYLVLDEATSMLDTASAAHIIDLLRKLHLKAAISIVHITHNPEEAILAQRVLVMHQGSIAMDGEPRDVFSRHEELASYGVSLPVAVRMAQLLKERGISVPAVSLTIRELAEALC